MLWESTQQILCVISNLTRFSNKKSMYTTELATRILLFSFQNFIKVCINKNKLPLFFVPMPFEPQKLTYPCTSSANILVLYPKLKCEILLPQFNFLTVNIYTKFKLSVKEQIDKNTKNLVDQPITPAVQIILQHCKGSSKLHIYCWMHSIHMTYKFEIYTFKHNKMEFCHAYWVISKCIHNQFGLNLSP